MNSRKYAFNGVFIYDHQETRESCQKQSVEIFRIALVMSDLVEYPLHNAFFFVTDLGMTGPVNGILGTFVRTEFADTPAKPEKE